MPLCIRLEATRKLQCDDLVSTESRAFVFQLPGEAPRTTQAPLVPDFLAALRKQLQILFNIEGEAMFRFNCQEVTLEDGVIYSLWIDQDGRFYVLEERSGVRSFVSNPLIVSCSINQFRRTISSTPRSS